MSTLLHIDSSVRAANNPNPDHDSISKNIALRFIDTWKQNRPEDEYIYRDVGVNPPDFITQEWISAVFTQSERDIFRYGIVIWVRVIRSSNA